MTVTAGRRGALSVLAIAAVAVAVVWVVFGRGGGSEPGSLGGFQAALHPVDVSAAEGDIARAADRGASSARLLVLTNQLIDLVGDDSKAERRRAIDGALASLSGAGCPVCEQALERARP